MTRKTLDDLNATSHAQRYEWGRYTLERRVAVGKAGRSSLRGRSGAKVHLLHVTTVVEERGEHKPGTYKVGERFSVTGFCGSNGQHTGLVMQGLDTDAVTCAKCLGWVEAKSPEVK